jgi:hypothetical protein
VCKKNAEAKAPESKFNTKVLPLLFLITLEFGVQGYTIL